MEKVLRLAVPVRAILTAQQSLVAAEPPAQRATIARVLFKPRALLVSTILVGKLKLALHAPLVITVAQLQGLVLHAQLVNTTELLVNPRAPPVL